MKRSRGIPPISLLLQRAWSNSDLRKATYVCVVVAVQIASVCWFFQIKSGRDIVAHVEMAMTFDRVWFDLTFGRLYIGQAVEDAITLSDPMLIVRHGRYIELSYQQPLSFTGLHITARDGRLVSAQAGSCTWDHTFFDGMTRADWDDCWASSTTNKREIILNRIVRN